MLVWPVELDPRIKTTLLKALQEPTGLALELHDLLRQ